MDTLASSDFLVDTQNSRLNVDAAGEELEQTINRFFNLGPAIVEKLKDIFKSIGAAGESRCTLGYVVSASRFQHCLQQIF